MTEKRGHVPNVEDIEPEPSDRVEVSSPENGTYETTMREISRLHASFVRSLQTSCLDSMEGRKMTPANLEQVRNTAQAIVQEMVREGERLAEYFEPEINFDGREKSLNILFEPEDETTLEVYRDGTLIARNGPSLDIVT